MTEFTSPVNERSAGRPRSAAAGRILARIVPVLRFDEPLESQFRRWHLDQSRARIRNAIWLPMSGLLLVALAGGPFEAMRAAIFGTQSQFVVDILRFAIIAPSCVAMLIVTYSSLYDRWFSLTAQIIAPVHSMCIVAMDILMHAQGFSLGAWMPLVTLAPYLFFEIQLAQAARTSIIVVLTYAISGYVAGLTNGQRIFDLTVVLFASSLGAAIHYSLQKAMRQNYVATQLLSESVNRDALTGIHNRRRFDEHIARVWQQAIRDGVPVALLMIDIDYFKAFNDRGGHQAGDVCLVKVAGVLSSTSRRPLDLTARYGGEEFAVLLYDVRRDRVEELCRQLHAGLASLAIPHPALGTGAKVTFSIGAACVEPRGDRRIEGFIQLADEALYAAKERGRDCTVVMDSEYETLDTGAFRSGHKTQSAAA